MRVMNRADFLKQPSGTVYAKGVRWAFDGLCIKGESLESDWAYLNPCWVEGYDSGECFDRLEEMLTKGFNYPGDRGGFVRDGLFETGAAFLVFDQRDLIPLIKRLTYAASL